MSRFDCRRCDWAPEQDTETAPKSQIREHAQDSRHPLCIVCGSSLYWEEPQTCTPCLATARKNLREISDLYALLPETLGQLNARPIGEGKPIHGDPPMQGGDALAMLSPGSEGLYWRGREQESQLAARRTPWRPVVKVRNATETEPTRLAEPNDNWPTDAPSIAFELSRWEDDFRHTKGEPAAETEATVTGSAGYLERRMGWAADNHPAFDEFASDLRKMLSRLRTATSTGERGQVGAPCLTCDGTLEREFGKEHYHCPKCKREYDRTTYWLAVRQENERRREETETA